MADSIVLRYQLPKETVEQSENVPNRVDTIATNVTIENPTDQQVMDAIHSAMQDFEKIVISINGK